MHVPSLACLHYLACVDLSSEELTKVCLTVSLKLPLGLAYVYLGTDMRTMLHSKVYPSKVKAGKQ
jgi:hypothetical protein